MHGTRKSRTRKSMKKQQQKRQRQQKKQQKRQQRKSMKKGGARRKSRKNVMKGGKVTYLKSSNDEEVDKLELSFNPSFNTKSDKLVLVKEVTGTTGAGKSYKAEVVTDAQAAAPSAPGQEVTAPAGVPVNGAPSAEEAAAAAKAKVDAEVNRLDNGGVKDKLKEIISVIDGKQSIAEFDGYTIPEQVTVGQDQVDDVPGKVKELLTAYKKAKLDTLSE